MSVKMEAPQLSPPPLPTTTTASATDESPPQSPMPSQPSPSSSPPSIKQEDEERGDRGEEERGRGRRDSDESGRGDDGGGGRTSSPTLPVSLSSPATATSPGDGPPPLQTHVGMGTFAHPTAAPPPHSREEERIDASRDGGSIGGGPDYYPPLQQQPVTPPHVPGQERDRRPNPPPPRYYGEEYPGPGHPKYSGKDQHGHRHQPEPYLTPRRLGPPGPHSESMPTSAHYSPTPYHQNYRRAPPPILHRPGGSFEPYTPRHTERGDRDPEFSSSSSPRAPYHSQRLGPSGLLSPPIPAPQVQHRHRLQQPPLAAPNVSRSGSDSTYSGATERSHHPEAEGKQSHQEQLGSKRRVEGGGGGPPKSILMTSSSVRGESRGGSGTGGAPRSSSSISSPSSRSRRGPGGPLPKLGYSPADFEPPRAEPIGHHNHHHKIFPPPSYDGPVPSPKRVHYDRSPSLSMRSGQSQPQSQSPRANDSQPAFHSIHMRVVPLEGPPWSKSLPWPSAIRSSAKEAEAALRG